VSIIAIIHAFIRYYSSAFVSVTYSNSLPIIDNFATHILAWSADGICTLEGQITDEPIVSGQLLWLKWTADDRSPLLQPLEQTASV